MSLYNIATVPKAMYDSKVCAKLGARNLNIAPEGLKFGLELEVENALGVHYPEGFNNYWGTHRDDSLRNNGIEYVTNTPLTKLEVLGALNILQIHLNTNRNLDLSERTSFHLHLNFADRTFRQIHNFLTLYYLIENMVVMRAGGENRYANLFCLKIQDANSVKRRILQTFSFTDLTSAFTVERYLALNLASIVKHKTLEFRAHKAVRDTQEYVKLTNVFEELYNFSMTIDTPFSIFQEMSMQGFMQYFRNNLPLTTVYCLESGLDFMEEINRASMFCQTLANAVTVVDTPVKKRSRSEDENVALDIDMLVDVQPQRIRPNAARFNLAQAVIAQRGIQ